MLWKMLLALYLLQPRMISAKKKAKKAANDLAQDTEFGNPWALLIDAGSTGSRLHLYEWEPRVYDTLPPPISKPFTSEVGVESLHESVYSPKRAAAASYLSTHIRSCVHAQVWTERMKPGISTFAHNPEGVGEALSPLIAFAKEQLAQLTDQWGSFPIYLKVELS